MLWSDTKLVKQPEDGHRIYAKLAGPKGHIFCNLLGASSSALAMELQLSNHEASRPGLQESGQEQQVPRRHNAEPWTISRCDK